MQPRRTLNGRTIKNWSGKQEISMAMNWASSSFILGEL
jgi:hypothetical protein